MTRKDLKQYRYTQEWIKDRKEYLREYKTTLENISAIVSDMPKGSRKTQDGFADKLAYLIDSVDEMIDKIAEQHEKQKKLLEQLDRVEQPYRMILEKVYILGKSLVTVASELGYSYEHIKHMNGIALLKFEGVIK